MSEGTQSVVSLRAKTENPLEGILREGARQMLQQAIEAEVAAYVAAHIECVDEQGKRLVVRAPCEDQPPGDLYFSKKTICYIHAKIVQSKL